MFIGIEDFSALQLRNVKFSEIARYEFKFFLTDFKREDS